MKSAKTKQSSPAANEQAAFFAKESDQDFFGSSEKEAQFFSPANTTSGSIQTRLSVGQVNDPYEKEADSVAEQVVQRKNEPVENSSQKKVKSGVKKISRKPIFCVDMRQAFQPGAIPATAQKELVQNLRTTLQKKNMVPGV